MTVQRPVNCEIVSGWHRFTITAGETVSRALHAGVISGSIRNGQRYIDPNNDVDRATMSVIMYNIVTKDIL